MAKMRGEFVIILLGDTRNAFGLCGGTLHYKDNDMESMEKYARLLVKVGINLQEGQTMVLSSPIECAEFVRIVQKEAYKVGAREIVLRWNDEKAERVNYDMAADAIFDEFPEWARAFHDDYAAADAAFLSIAAEDPEIMKGVDPKRISRKAKARNKALKNFRERQMSNKNVWCVASVPTAAWARKVFPGTPGTESVEALWRAIYQAVRVDQDDPVRAWQGHQAALKLRLDFLNKAKFRFLRYRNARGTDFKVGLPEGHIWYGGGDVCEKGYIFVPNMPTEEIFTMPRADEAEGKLVCSMPLNHHGNLIENFWFRFEGGKVVDFGAEKGADNLAEMLDTDAGARRLGEVALVPHDSPISNQRILYYNTLFDENASCHFALGKAYPTCIKGGTAMSPDQQAAAGVNDSLIHVDFMMGTSDLEIIGIRKDGGETPVFKNGNFAF